MIDWIASGITLESVTSRSKVVVVCNICDKKRTIQYKSAKGLNDHPCIGCSLANETRQNEIVVVTCACGATAKRKYRHSRHSKPWKCLKCAMKVSAAEGRIKPNIQSLPRGDKLSSISKVRWADQNYRDKLTAIRRQRPLKSKRMVYVCSSCNTDKEVNRRYGLRRGNRVCASCAARLKWNNRAYYEFMTGMISTNTKKLWQNEEYRDKVTSNNSKIWNTRRDELSKRANELWADEEYRNKVKQGMADPEARKKLAIAIASQANRISSLQYKLYDYLADLGVVYEKESASTVIGYYPFDCLVPKNNSMAKHLLIECQGDYWHSLPSKQRQDRSKFTYIDRYFPEYEIMYIWEHEFYTKDRVLDRLKLKLGLSLDAKEFNFKDVIVKEVSAADVRSFLDCYHYIGKGRGGNSIGAYLNDELIGCVVYSPPIRQNMNEKFGKFVELARLCIHPAYHKKNFASWLISKSLRFVKGFNVVSYADKTVGHVGTVYKASGFKLSHTVPADYWYVDGEGYVMHKKTLYDRAVKMAMSERDFANKNGYMKKYGGEKLCFVKEL